MTGKVAKDQSSRIPLVEAAQILRLTYQQAHNAVLAGRLAAERIDGKWFVRKAAIDEFRILALRQ